MSKRGVCQINIGGKERVFSFRMGFWELIEKEYDTPLGHLMNFVEKQGFKEIIDLFYCGLLNGTREPDFDRRDVVDWIEDLQETEEGEKEIQKVFEAYLDSRQVGQMLDAAEKITAEINSKKQEEDTKKK